MGDAEHRTASDERAAVVAWLRKRAAEHQKESCTLNGERARAHALLEVFADECADDIERGAHVAERDAGERTVGR